MPKPEPPNDLWAQLDRIEKECVVIKPEGAFSCSEYAKRKGISYNAADQILRHLEKSGKLERIEIPNSKFHYWRIKA
jgi:ribosomal protein S25